MWRKKSKGDRDKTRCEKCGVAFGWEFLEDPDAPSLVAVLRDGRLIKVCPNCKTDQFLN